MAVSHFVFYPCGALYCIPCIPFSESGKNEDDEDNCGGVLSLHILRSGKPCNNLKLAFAIIGTTGSHGACTCGSHYPLILQLIEQHHVLSTVLGKSTHFCWIPSHVGIKGNDLADQAAKDATNDDPSRGGRLTINFMPFSLLWAAGLEVGVTLAERK